MTLNSALYTYANRIYANSCTAIVLVSSYSTARFGFSLLEWAVLFRGRWAPELFHMQIPRRIATQ